jgi:hypothetical protein
LPSGDKDAKFLRELQGFIKAGLDRPFTPKEVRRMPRWRDRYDQIALDRQGYMGDPIGAWARRLGDELNDIINEYEVDEPEPELDFVKPNGQAR